MFRMYVSIALMSATVAYADSVGMVSDNSAKTITVLGAEAVSYTHLRAHET